MPLFTLREKGAWQSAPERAHAHPKRKRPENSLVDYAIGDLFYWFRGSEPEPGALLGCEKGNNMAWTTPTLVEICIGLEINGYLPAEL
jgi:coenzyme PQQ precursor peptide PqqA